MKTELEIQIYNYIKKQKHVNLVQIIDHFLPKNLESFEQAKKVIKIKNTVENLKKLNYIETNDNFDCIAKEIIV